MATPTLAHFKLPQIDNEPMVKEIIFYLINRVLIPCIAQLCSWFC